jgi:hypothetical protein
MNNINYVNQMIYLFEKILINIYLIIKLIIVLIMMIDFLYNCKICIICVDVCVCVYIYIYIYILELHIDQCTQRKHLFLLLLSIYILFGLLN